MFKLLLKHSIFDFALNMMFDKISENISTTVITSLIGKSVVVKVSDTCKNYHAFNTNYQYGILAEITNEKYGYFIKLVLPVGNSNIAHAMFLRSDEIISIKESPCIGAYDVYKSPTPLP